MVGYIYLSICTVTQKVYIGMTIQKYKQRWRDHIKESFNPNSGSYNYYFHKAIRKYGKLSFKWSILETVYEKDVNILISRLKELEIKYIKEYNSFKSGYNSTAGGDTSKKEYQTINVYDDRGNLLNSFQSVCDASEYYNISKSTIWQCCSRHTLYTRYNSSRIVFRWTSHDLSKDDLEKLNKVHYDSSVSMYDLSGNLLQEFVNIKDASEKLNINRHRITCNCIKKSSFVLIDGVRYIFRYFDDQPTDKDIKKVISIKSDPRSKVQAIDSFTNKILGEFYSQKEAARYFNISANNISEVCTGKRKTAGKFQGHPIKWIKI